jgi:hypothetical protein
MSNDIRLDHNFGRSSVDEELMMALPLCILNRPALSFTLILTLSYPHDLIMQSCIILQACILLFISLGVNGTPPQKHPFTDLNIDLNREASPQSPPRLEGPTPDIQKDTTRPDSIQEASSSQSKQAKWSDARQASIDNLLMSNIQAREDAFNRIQATLLVTKGRLYSMLNDAEKARIGKARTSLHSMATKARKQGDITLLYKVTEMLRDLPTNFILRHTPQGPLTPDLERRIKQAKKSRRKKDAKAARLFMEKEFGFKLPPQRKGPKPLDLSKLDPEDAKRIEKTRVKNAKKRERQQQQKALTQGGNSAENTLSGTAHDLNINI